jgi:hypothetical protein
VHREEWFYRKVRWRLSNVHEVKMLHHQ